MILDELTLHDFGLYRGRNCITLAPPSPERPVVLFGGLNGAGKTTLLDAVQLCLFGQHARVSNRNGSAYEDYLAGSIHRAPGVNEASVELAFRSTIEGEEVRYRVRRSWRRTNKGLREQLEVLRNHRFDRVATEHWNEQVEEFLPARIAHLFFFDGEKIEGYAEPSSSAALIETAIHNLLGLDLVERLSADLSVLERRRKLENRDKGERQDIEVAERRAESAIAERERAHQRAAKARVQLGTATSRLEELERRFKREGGDLYEQRATVSAERSAAEASMRMAEKELRDVAASAAPLLLVKDLLGEVAEQGAREIEGQRASTTLGLLQARDAELMAHLRASGEEALANQVAAYLDADRAARAATRVESHLGLSAESHGALLELLRAELPEAEAAATTALAAERQARGALEEALTRYAAVPEEVALSELLAAREAALVEVRALELELGAASEQHERAKREAERADAELQRLHALNVQLGLDQDDLERSLKHSARVRGTLERFRTAMIARHLERIERLVLDSFKQLVRKKSLVASLRIDPLTFQLSMETRDGGRLTPERLSAGERQLLAVAVLWGLARASGRPLPMVVDTPLGRLDSSHRRRLVSHYFPQASHQVILLSTDEEISGAYLAALKPFIGRSYQLVHDEETGATSVEAGYFAEGGELVH